MRRPVLVGLVLALLTALAFGVGAGPAAADGCTDMVCPNPPTGDPNPPPPKNTGSGQPAHTQVKSCSLYATAASFGLTCVEGSSGDVVKVKDILKNQQSPCWDVLISDHDLVTKYGIPLDTKNPDAPYYLHSCITGLDLNASLYHQPNAQLNQHVITILVGAPECQRPYKDADVATCVMTLTQQQQTVVNALASKNAQIPEPVVVTDPAADVRTNEAVTYIDAPLVDGRAITRTRTYYAGGVGLYAERVAFRIYPYGPDHAGIACSGQPTGAGACVWSYPQSSAHQPGLVYPFRAVADWNVYYVVGGVRHQLGGTFHKPADLELPVKDVQSVVVH